MKLSDFIDRPLLWLLDRISNTERSKRWLRAEKRSISGELKVSMLTASSLQYVSLKALVLREADATTKARDEFMFEFMLPSSESKYLLEWRGENTPCQAVLPDSFVDLYEGWVYDEKNHTCIGLYYILYGAHEGDQDCMLIFINPPWQLTSSKALSC